MAPFRILESRIWNDAPDCNHHSRRTSHHFPRDLAGRANTAHNVLVFITAFIVQWSIGGILRAWEDTTTHQYDPTGYQVAFIVVAALQVRALA